MSNFMSKAKRPQGEDFEGVEMMDDYYGPHKYGVRFPDGAVYRDEECEYEDDKS